MFFRFLFTFVSLILLQAASGTAHASTFRLSLEPTEASTFAIEGFFEVEIIDGEPVFGAHSIDVAAGTIVSSRETVPISAINYSSEVASARINRFYGLIFSAGLQPVPGSPYDKISRRELRLAKSRWNQVFNTLKNQEDVDMLTGMLECFNCTPSRGTAGVRITSEMLDDSPVVVPLPATLALSLGWLVLLGSLKFGRNRA